MDIYKSKVTFFTSELSKINTKYNSISLFRLLSIFLFLTSIYFYIQKSEGFWVLLAVLFFAAFLVLMRIHSRLSFQRLLTKALVKINEDEISFLKREKIPFENGEEFQDFNHSYAYDLDIFGAHSLFQNLNRTATFIGKKTLAASLLHKVSNQEILDNQQSIKELNQKIDWRQGFLALAKVSQDNQNSYEALMKWNKNSSADLSKTSIVLSYFFPALFVGTLIAYLITSSTVFLSGLSYVFIINLMFLGKFIKRIQSEITNAENIDKIIAQYGLLVKKIEDEKFHSQKLIDLQQRLQFKSANASIHLKKLSELFSRMDTIANLVTATVFNGTFLFNFHVLKALLNWKKEHSAVLEDWLIVIGEFEKLNSLANFSYNNPEFAYPELNSDYKINFSNLGHPLLNPETRVGNDSVFYPQSFVILTGSNMSGKSTFLRSLGINMVLAGTGAVVCASEAQVHPLPVLVSMRLSDSLSDSESYFFAEIKRLKQIMDALEVQPAFVLLDEILRGTNSDDKRNGTIEVLKKVIAKKAIGVIATHDIEVCLTTNEYPEILSNNCFEVEIKNDDLHFDYKLRNGICKNKSATFLMKKMGVI
ncbi:DNA mismatch repair protein [Flavobacterium sp. FZUC8N2.13]|uniref:DNA mismatch repair protein n=1 Tax=Flavobacterium zubiriense TaxID=3138075 RepID=A0ABV4TC79_9FLAO